MFGWFRKNKTEQLAPIGLHAVAVDMHSHVLPGIDDGAKTVEDSVPLIQALIDVGIKKIIATPHIMADYYKNNKTTITAALEELKQHLASINLQIEIEAAAEHYFDEYFFELIDTDNLMLMNGKYVLFELPFTSMPINVLQTIKLLTSKGLTPILAHPERYTYLTMEEMTELRSWGCFMQMNTIALTGYYGKDIKQRAEQMVDAGVVDFISSDMHHERHAEALRKVQTSPYLKKLLDQNQLQNSELLS